MNRKGVLIQAWTTFSLILLHQADMPLSFRYTAVERITDHRYDRFRYIMAVYRSFTQAKKHIMASSRKAAHLKPDLIQEIR